MAKSKMNKDLVINVVLVLILVGILCVSYKLYLRKGFNKEQFTNFAVLTCGERDTCGDPLAVPDACRDCDEQVICPNGYLKTKNRSLYPYKVSDIACPDCPNQQFTCLNSSFNCDNHNCIGTNYYGCVQHGNEFKCQKKDGTFDFSKKCCGEDDNTSGEPSCDELYTNRGCYGDNYQGCEHVGNQRWKCKKNDGTYDYSKKCCGSWGKTNGVWGWTPNLRSGLVKVGRHLQNTVYRPKLSLRLVTPINLDGASIQIRNRFYGKIIAYYSQRNQLRALPIRYHSQQDYSKWLCEKVGNTNKYRLKNFYTGTYLSSDGGNLRLTTNKRLALAWEIRGDNMGTRGKTIRRDNLNRIIMYPSVNIKASMLITGFKGYMSLRSNKWGTPVFRTMPYQDLDNRARFELIIDFSPPLIAVNKGGEGCTPNNKCDIGEGDCDEDADCKGNLECVQRNSTNDTIPGLLIGGGYPAKHDICWRNTILSPTTLPPTTLSPTTLSPTLTPTTLALTTIRDLRQPGWSGTRPQLSEQQERQNNQQAPQKNSSVDQRSRQRRGRGRGN